ncbi:MAG: O-antigen ligase family protein [Patescibacteria group bacterium]|jgi:O-antigen ligase
MRIHKYLLYLSILLIPVNLGKHFVLSEAYVNGRLIDYLVPAVFLPDILIVLTLLFWILGIKNPLKHLWLLISSEVSLTFGVLFLAAMFFAVLGSPMIVPAVYFFVRLIIYFLFCIYLFDTFDVKNDFEVVLKILSIQVLFLSLLAFGQWIKQGSVFNNYLVLGEQPYGYSTQNIIKENFFGVTKIPPHSLFRHPNAFGGYLSIVLVWLFYSFRKGRSPSILSLGAFLAGTISLFLTLSYMAWASFVFGLIAVFLLEKLNVTFRKILFLLSLLILISGFSLVFFEKIPIVSLQRRSDLMSASFSMFVEKPLFGIGVNNSTALMEKAQVDSNMARFPQPVHNIFMLLLAESGVLATLFFLLFLGTLSLKKGKFYLLGVTLVQIILLSSVDHYFLTAHQTSALMWLTFGLALIQFY